MGLMQRGGPSGQAVGRAARKHTKALRKLRAAIQDVVLTAAAVTDAMRDADYADYYGEELFLHSNAVIKELNQAYYRATHMFTLPVYGRENDRH